jgi:D-alanyl-D-alanine carboxypeptidase (penicillin-binding protein 5/6)
VNTNKVIQGKKENLKREIASITKMMTFYTVLKLMEKYNMNPETTILTVSKSASLITGTSANIREGDQLTVN